MLLLCAGCGTEAAEPLHLSGAPMQSGDLDYRGGLVLDGLGGGVGGISGLAVTADGAEALLVSDTGAWFQLALAYDASGRLADAALRRRGRLIDESGLIPRSKGRTDSEDLAVRPDGTLIVAFEQRHRLLAYAPTDPPFARVPTRLPQPPGISSAPSNGGLEAVTELAGGGLLAVAEDLIVLRDSEGEWAAAWLDAGQGWAPLAYHVSDGYKPTSAALLPGGDVVVLERRAGFPLTLAARLMRVPAAQLKPGARVRAAEIARMDPAVIRENFEGVAVRRGAAGEMLIYLTSDDNFLPLLRTVLLVFALKD